MSKLLIRAILLVAVVIGFFWYFSPRSVSSAANALLTSVDATLTQAQGLAQFVPGSDSQSKSGTLQVKMDSLNPSTSYEVTLDQGHCGAVSKDLGVVLTDNNGSFNKSFSLTGFTPDSTWYVNVHDQNADGPSIACGQLQTNSSLDVQAVDTTQTDQTPTPTPAPNLSAGSTPAPTGMSPSGIPNGMPRTGVDPGNDQQYDNSKYPRKY